MTSEREQLEQSLSGLAANARALTAQRDLLIRRALALGITKHRIYVLTGIARTTIDRIIAKEDDDDVAFPSDDQPNGLDTWDF
jgi:hypothetical protein